MCLPLWAQTSLDGDPRSDSTSSAADVSSGADSCVSSGPVLPVLPPTPTVVEKAGFNLKGALLQPLQVTAVEHAFRILNDPSLRYQLVP
jgi:hypothetical protein